MVASDFTLGCVWPTPLERCSWQSICYCQSLEPSAPVIGPESIGVFLGNARHSVPDEKFLAACPLVALCFSPLYMYSVVESGLGVLPGRLCGAIPEAVLAP